MGKDSSRFRGCSTLSHVVFQMIACRENDKRQASLACADTKHAVAYSTCRCVHIIRNSGQSNIRLWIT